MHRPSGPSRRAVLAGATALALVPGCAAGADGPSPAPSVPSAGPSSEPLPVPSPTPAGPVLTARQQAAQRVIFSYSGTTVPPELLGLIAEGLVGGVILFGENVSSLAQITAAVGQLHKANQDSPVGAPLLVMADQEGGQVRRLPGGPEESAKQTGASPDPAQAAARAGREAGALLRGAGLNVNLAPVLDVFREPGDFADRAQRSYSADPQTVAACGRAFLTEQQGQGVAATAKHFPGLGPAAAAENTDLRPVTLATSPAELRRVDEVPYRTAVAAGVQLVMVSWATYPQLDPARPAGLSRAVIQDELRGRIGFGGVTVSDSLTAKAVAAFGTPAEVAAAGAAAGLDLLLDCSGTVAGGQAVTEALTATPSDEALARILALRRTLSGF